MPVRMKRKKSKLHFLGRALSVFAALIGLAALVLLARPLFSAPLDIKRYTAAEANEYHALPVSGANFKANSRDDGGNGFV